MNKQINYKSIVQNAENKKDVSSEDTKLKGKSSVFGIKVEELLLNYDFGKVNYGTTLAEDIISLCKENGILTDGVFQQKTCVLRVQYSRLKGDKYLIPKKEILFSICIGLKLDIEKTAELMEKGGYLFTYDSKFELENNLPSFDRLIHDCICLKIYDIDKINNFLVKNGYKERLGSRTIM